MGENGTYDLVVIGAGQGGIPLVDDLASAGMRVAIVERKHLGGSCVNFGCTPTKAAIASAKLAYDARRAKEFGIDIPEVRADFQAVLERARKIAELSRSHLREDLAGKANPTLLHGHARLGKPSKGGFSIDVDGREICAKQVVLDTGTRTLVPPVEGIDEVDYITSGNWLHQRDVPAHLIVLGGGYIGVEMAQMYRRLDCAVTLVEKSDQILPREDPDVAEALQAFLELEDIEIIPGAEALAVRPHAEGLRVHVRTRDGETDIAGTHLYVATGRRPNTDDLGLYNVGVKVDEKGFVQVDEKLATSAPNIWACGDIRGGPMFTHTSWDDYRILKSQIIGDGSRTTKRLVPYAVFCDPQLGRVGITEEQARQKGRDVLVNRFEMVSNGKAREDGETRGFIKVVLEPGTHELLGAAVVSAEGAELVHLYEDIMNTGQPATAIENAVYIHPTLAEAVQSAVTLSM